jgi:hypothetical protein
MILAPTPVALTILHSATSELTVSKKFYDFVTGHSSTSPVNGDIKLVIFRYYALIIVICKHEQLMLHSFGQTLPNISLILLYAVC